jgi:hypothetical protein
MWLSNKLALTLPALNALIHIIRLEIQMNQQCVKINTILVNT